jgi:hypothetical protein
MTIITNDIDYFTFSQELFKGKEIYNKNTGVVLQKWEAYIICKKQWDLVYSNSHYEWGHRDKEGYKNGVYKGRILKAIKKFWKNKGDI